VGNGGKGVCREIERKWEGRGKKSGKMEWMEEEGRGGDGKGGELHVKPQRKKILATTLQPATAKNIHVDCFFLIFFRCIMNPRVIKFRVLTLVSGYPGT